ncbi:MAG: primosomal protein N' [Chromatiaceae bacterium]|nr:primosomal protein N' [Chromatiaceae bacterium]
MPEDPAIILRIAVPVPLPGLFDYLPLAAEGSPQPQPGMRVQVSFGSRVRVGMIVALAQESDQEPDRLKPILALLDFQPLLGADDLELILWAADYYRQPPGEALFSALPARLRRAEPPLEPVQPGQPGWRLTATGREQAPGTRARRQAEIQRLLGDYPEGLGEAALRSRLGEVKTPLRALAERGWIEPCHLLGDEPAKAPESGPELNPRQTEAIAAVSDALGRFQTFLLEGVTGSGKTEVYIRLLLRVLEAGGQALLLVPEIGLTPQLRRRLARRFPGRLAILHSALNATERERAWQAAARGAADLVLGTRSAVFVPLPRLRLILVDEEHDLSFKQQDGFRYSARDLAVRRAQRAGCPLVLGSATPSLESLRNAATGRYQRLELPERAGAAAPPAIGLLDIRGQPLRGGLSAVLIRLMREQFEAGNQVLLFLNRRGFSPVLTCHQCGWVGDCPHCDARLTLHLADNRLWCHHCGLTQPIPVACPQCGGLDIRALGQGTERLAGELQALFPDIRVARVDRDSTRRKGELDRLLAAALAGDYPLLVGTQMLAKGHHFPRVTLVGILDADNGLYGSDFRAAERMAQLVIQVAGRAGRAERPGRVVLQTHHPDHPLLQTLRRQGYPAFAAAALRERREAGLPPFTHQALLRVEAAAREASLGWLRLAREAACHLGGPRISLFGPVPAPMERRAGRYRAQLLVQARERPELQAFLAAWVPQLYGIKGQGASRWSLDVDPQEMF